MANNSPVKQFIDLVEKGVTPPQELLQEISDLLGRADWSVAGQNSDSVTTLRKPINLAAIEIAPVRRRGRPKNEKGGVSYFLHERMVHSLKKNTGITLRAARIQAARLMSVGGIDDAAAERHMRAEARRDVAICALANVQSTLVFLDDDGNKHTIIAIEKTARITYCAKEIELAGRVWACQWGDKNASYGTVQCTIPILNAPFNDPKLLQVWGGNNSTVSFPP